MIKSSIMATKTLSLLTIAAAVLAFHPQPAAAQSATSLNCKGCLTSKQLKNGKVKGKDLKNSTVTGSKIAPNAVDGSKIAPDAVDGSKIADGAVGSSELSSSVTVGGGVTLDGATGTVSNSLTGDGVVKAWARINEDGTIESCYRCNTDTAQTRMTSTGIYEVDFTPVSTDISARPHIVSCSGATLINPACEIIKSNFQTGDSSSLLIRTFNQAGNNDDSDFTVMLF